MYIATIPNRTSPPAILLRQGYREGKRVKTRTLANLSDWPASKIEMFRRLLRDEAVVTPADALEIVRSRPHGHVMAVIGTLRRVGLPDILSRVRTPQRDCVEAIVAARILHPRSKLATARALNEETQWTSLGEVVGVSDIDEDDLYEAMDWVLARQDPIERALAKRHLSEGTLVLYDVTSTYFEGRSCPLAHFGHDRDGKKGKLQIVVGLLCNGEGCPVAVEVFDGNTGDPKTLGKQIEKVRKRFGLSRIVWVGDRGMITEARIKEELRPLEGVSWITALRASSIRALVEQKALQLSLFDEKDLAEITSPDYPGERLMACRNPFLAEERTRKREDLLQATEKQLDKIVQATTRAKRKLKGKDAIGIRLGKVVGQYKMAKHFIFEITEESFRYQRNGESIREEAALDGIYVIRTNLPAETISAQDTVRAYKSLSAAERAFRSLKTVDLKLRPIHHRTANRVRAHVFLCMLAYYVEWHMRRALASLLFDDDDKKTAEAQRASVVQPAQRSPEAQRKAFTKRTTEGFPVQSFQTLLSDLATVTKNRIQPNIEGAPAFDRITTPTPLQQRAFDLLGVSYRM